MESENDFLKNLFDDSKSDESHLRASLGSLQGQDAKTSSVIPAESSNGPNILPLDELLLKEKKGAVPEALKPKYKKKINNKSTAPGRRFQLTLNQPEKWPQLIHYIENLGGFHYGIATKEVAPETGHVHIHLFCQYKFPVRLSYDLAQHAHIEKCKGSTASNIAYIKKENEPSKKGEIIYETKDKIPFGIKEEGEEPRDVPTIDEARIMTNKELGHLDLNFYNTVKDLERINNNKLTGKKNYKTVKVFYIWGPSGSGKSLWAKWMFRNTTYDDVKHIGEFWHGTSDNGTKACIYDDFRDSHMSPSEFINFIDYSIHNLNIKNGSIKNYYKYIIITSIQDPHDIYAAYQEKNYKEEPSKQWLRRMRVLKAEDECPPDKIKEMLEELGYIDEPDPDDPFFDY